MRGGRGLFGYCCLLCHLSSSLSVASHWWTVGMTQRDTRGRNCSPSCAGTFRRLSSPQQQSPPESSLRSSSCICSRTETLGITRSQNPMGSTEPGSSLVDTTCTVIPGLEAHDCRLDVHHVD